MKRVLILLSLAAATTLLGSCSLTQGGFFHGAPAGVLRYDQEPSKAINYGTAGEFRSTYNHGVLDVK